MKILRVTPTFYPDVTGPVYQAYRTAKGLKERGHKPTIVTSSYRPDSGGYPPDMEPGDEFPFPVKRYRTIISIQQYRVAPFVAAELMNGDYDIIHAHGYHNALKDIFYISNKFTDIPFVLHAHGGFGWKEASTQKYSFHYKIYDQIWGRTAINADAVVVSTEQEREEARQFGVPENKIRVISVGKDKESFISIPADSNDDLVRFLFVGRLGPRRNVESILKAAAQLDTNNFEIRIVGDETVLSGSSRSGYLNELINLSEELGISNNVKFTGAKYGDELIREYRNAHVFINPSEYENFGQTTLEAAYAGSALIATPTGVANDLIQSGVTGFHFNTDDELVEKMKMFIDDFDLAKRIGDQAQQKAIENHSWDKIVPEYESLYQSLI